MKTAIIYLVNSINSTALIDELLECFRSVLDCSEKVFFFSHLAFWGLFNSLKG